MADDIMDLSELVLINTPGVADIQVSDLLDHAPLLRRLHAALSSNGTDHKYLKETGAPVVGFRAVNTGRDHDVSADTLVTINLKILDASFHADKAVADAYRPAHASGGRDAFMAREGMRHLRAAFFGAEQQIVNGVGADAGGFVGLADASTVDALADEMVVNAEGTTAATASSVYFIRTDADESAVTLISNGVIEMGEIYEQLIADGDGKKFPAYASSICSWLALQIGSKHDLGRICNLTEDTGKGLTDVLLSKMLEKFPSHKQPNLIVMSRRSRGQLQRSRTTYSPTGAPAPLPQEYEGIPIITTEAITNTEALLT